MKFVQKANASITDQVQLIKKKARGQTASLLVLGSFCWLEQGRC